VGLAGRVDSQFPYRDKSSAFQSFWVGIGSQFDHLGDSLSAIAWSSNVVAEKLQCFSDIGTLILFI
jgi:hypothetical protein